MTGISVAKETICCGLDMYMNVGYYTSKGIGCITWFNMVFSDSLVHDTPMNATICRRISSVQSV